VDNNFIRFSQKKNLHQEGSMRFARALGGFDPIITHTPFATAARIAVTVGFSRTDGIAMLW
jgi:hypothetical protein